MQYIGPMINLLWRGWPRMAGLAGALVGVAFLAQASVAADGPDFDPDEGHIRVQNPADLDPADAEKLYQRLLDPMVQGYLKSGLYDIDYRDWHRFNSQPYLSDQHGARLVNVYANDAGREMLDASTANPMPVGAKIAKDSVSVVKSGGTARGPLFLMEKMSPGFAPEFGNWRYTMVMPNGKIFGATRGGGSSVVKFCAECHALAADNDYLFPLPHDVLIGQ